MSDTLHALPPFDGTTKQLSAFCADLQRHIADVGSELTTLNPSSHGKVALLNKSFQMLIFYVRREISRSETYKAESSPNMPRKTLEVTTPPKLDIPKQEEPENTNEIPKLEVNKESPRQYDAKNNELYTENVESNGKSEVSARNRSIATSSNSISSLSKSLNIGKNSISNSFADLYSDLDNEKKIQRLRFRVEKLQNELALVHKSFSRLRDFRNRIEFQLCNAKAGPQGLSVIAVKEGTLRTRSTGMTNMWKKRTVVLTESNLYVFRQISGDYELVAKIPLGPKTRYFESRSDESHAASNSSNLNLDVIVGTPNEERVFTCVTSANITLESTQTTTSTTSNIYKSDDLLGDSPSKGFVYTNKEDVRLNSQHEQAEHVIEFLADSEAEKQEWLRNLEQLTLQLINPLARFRIDTKETLLPALCKNEYRLATAIVATVYHEFPSRSEGTIGLILDALSSNSSMSLTRKSRSLKNVLSNDEISIAKLFNSDGLECARFIKHLIAQEVESTREYSGLFRENSQESKVLKVYTTQVGTKYLVRTLSIPLLQIISKNANMEIFENKLTQSASQSSNSLQETTNLNRANIEEAFQLIFNSLLASKNDLPWQINAILHHIVTATKYKFPENSAIHAAASFFFLRFICPAIVVPDQAQVVTTTPPKNIQRGLLFISKILQTMANNVTFGSKEPQMIPFNVLIERSRRQFESFLLDITTPPPVPISTIDNNKTFSDASFAKLKAEIVSILDKLEPVLFSNV